MPEVPLIFYIGVKEIAAFLKLHPKTAQKKLQEGKLPAKKDGLGRWVLTNIDYLKSLSDKNHDFDN